MNRPLACALCLAVTALSLSCSAKQTPTTETTNQSAQSGAKESPAKPAATQATSSAPTGDLQAGQASGTYTTKGETVEVKYAYAGRAERFGSESLVILLTDKPIPPEALAEEIKSAALLEGEKIRGLEYVMMDENSMWVRYHPGQYQQSSSNKLKEYRVENGVVRGIDDDDGDLSDGKYPRSVRFVATIAK